MRTTVLAGLVAAAFPLVCPLVAAAADVSAPIASVILYPGSATVVRTVRVTPGMNQFTVQLPARFDAQTLRAEAGEGIRIGDIVTRDNARNDAVNPAEAELEAKLQALKDQQAVLDAEVKAAEIVKGYLERVDGGAAQGAAPRMPTDGKTLAGVVDTLGRSAADTMLKIQRLAVQQRELGKKVDAVQRDLARMRTGLKDLRSVTVNLAAHQAGEVKLSYQVPNAGWKPSYRAALDASSSRLELERMATVSQKTGEDWSNVKLVLSTSQPRQAQGGPDPRPWLLGYRPPQKEVALQELARYAPSAPPMPAAAPSNAGMARDDSYNAPTFETQGMYATEFEVPARTSLPSDGREIALPLARTALAVRQYLLAAPRQDSSATVMAEADRPDGVWPAGPVQLLRDGSYVGSGYWNPQASERFEFSFGRDDLVRIQVDDVKGDSGSGGLFGTRAERRIANVYRITNAHKAPVKLVVLEASPVSTSDEVKVKTVFDPKPTTEEWKKRRGVVAWERTLGAGETAKISVDYTVDHPREGIVTGMR